MCWARQHCPFASRPQSMMHTTNQHNCQAAISTPRTTQDDKHIFSYIFIVVPQRAAQRWCLHHGSHRFRARCLGSQQLVCTRASVVLTLHLVTFLHVPAHVKETSVACSGFVSEEFSEWLRLRAIPAVHDAISRHVTPAQPWFNETNYQALKDAAVVNVYRRYALTLPMAHFWARGVLARHVLAGKESETHTCHGQIVHCTHGDWVPKSVSA